MADYRDHYPQIQSAGADVAAVSVDPPAQSEALRLHLSLPFPILCDTERRVVKPWNLYNAAERGGIAKPSVFIVDPSQVIRYAAADGVALRIPAAQIVALLQNSANPVRRRVYLPLLSDWIDAIRNSFRK